MYLAKREKDKGYRTKCKGTPRQEEKEDVVRDCTTCKHLDNDAKYPCVKCDADFFMYEPE